MIKIKNNELIDRTILKEKIMNNQFLLAKIQFYNLK